eukprot:5300944-Pyramimonas_sp.AAC.1
MKARWAMKPAAILGRAPRCVASNKLGNRPFTRERREPLCISPMALLRRTPRWDFCVSTAP